MTVLNDSGEIWCAPNPSVYLAGNWTMARKQNPVIDAERGTQPCSDCSEVLVRA